MEWIIQCVPLSVSADEIEEKIKKPGMNLPELFSNLYSVLGTNYKLKADEFKKIIDMNSWNPSYDDQKKFASNINMMLDEKLVRDLSSVLEKIEMAQTFGNYDFSNLKRIVENRIK